MAGRGWVYRRPFTAVRRRFVPQTFAASRIVVRQRRRVQQVRRRFFLRRRLPVVLGVAAAVVVSSPIVRAPRRARVQPQRQPLRHPLVILGVAAPVAGVSPPPIRPPHRVRLEPPRPPIRHPPLVPAPTFVPPVPGFGFVVRLHKAVAEIRRAMRRSLRWRQEEIPPIIGAPEEEVFASPKGRIFTPGLRRGRITGGGTSG